MSDITTTGNGAVPPSLLNFIERASRDDSIDLEKLERLLQMQERLVAEDARKAFNAAMSAAQGQMRAIWRDSQNTQTNSRYAKLETIDDKIRPVYTEHGFSLTFGTEAPRDPASIRIVCTCAHRAGHEQQYELEAPPDMTGARGQVNKTILHGMGSTITYLRRYLTMMIFNIVLTSEDDDGVAAGMGENARKTPPPRPAATKPATTPTPWVDGVCAKLRANASPEWKWLAALLAEIPLAPTHDDLISLGDEQGIQDTMARMPAKQRAQVEAAFNDRGAMLDEAAEAAKWQQQTVATDKPADALDTVLDGPGIDGDETRVAKLVALIRDAASAEEVRRIMSSIIHENFMARIMRETPTLAGQVIAAQDSRIAELRAP